MDLIFVRVLLKLTDWRHLSLHCCHTNSVFFTFSSQTRHGRMYQWDGTMLRSNHVCWSDVTDHWSNDIGQTGRDNICKVSGKNIILF